MVIAAGTDLIIFLYSNFATKFMIICFKCYFFCTMPDYIMNQSLTHFTLLLDSTCYHYYVYVYVLSFSAQYIMWHQKYVVFQISNISATWSAVAIVTLWILIEVLSQFDTMHFNVLRCACHRGTNSSLSIPFIKSFSQFLQAQLSLLIFWLNYRILK